MKQIDENSLLALLKDQYELQLLKDAGVDNWDGYTEALNPYNGQSYDEYCSMNPDSILKPFKDIKEENNE